jgi:hypothetical protein
VPTKSSLGSLAKSIVIVLTASLIAYGQGNTFKKIRYQGGSIASNVKPDDWNNTLTVTSDEIKLDFKDGSTCRIDPKKVTGLSYGQAAHRRVATMVLLAVFLTPVALFGLLHKTRKHFVGIEWQDAEGKKNGVLLQADKDNYKGVLMALRGVTGAPVAVSAEERKYVPTGIETIILEKEKKSEDKEKKPEPEKPKP